MGNTRVTFAKNNAGMLESIDTNNYYPFGLNHIGGSSYSKFGSYYNYKYQGQELQETGFYSFKWRNYMPDIGRFFCIDPLAEKYTHNSTYAFSENRVIDARELEGLEAELINKSTRNTSVSNDISGFNLNTPAKVELRTNVTQGSFTNEQVQQKLSTVENNFRKEGLDLTIIQDSNATYNIDMTFSGRSVVIQNNDGTTTRGTVLGDAPLGNPITATVNAKNGNTDTITHEIAHTFGAEHIWEPNSGVENTPANINNRMNSYENPTPSMKGLGTEFNTNQIQKMEETIKANSFRLPKK
ncbi:RHS repeat-associated protein [Chryseobacterium vietnamense]|uniref:RHS repeat-associated core domain-containing protein n=1 Tax=Chryseobacterium vietnamense TaxID=866785 RepID=UPI00285FF9F2|nr:RHS repeat-associated core domain-containing protein [Chryseobacterium vietnamense]MDR6489144.1 RHS repeat-associated protein [Chryseobacterium vietnamense]